LLFSLSGIVPRALPVRRDARKRAEIAHCPGAAFPVAWRHPQARVAPTQHPLLARGRKPDLEPRSRLTP